MVLTLSFLPITPRISKRDGKLHIHNSALDCLFTLGLIYRHVIVDPKMKVGVVQRRLFWFFTRRMIIPFGRIKAISYSYSGTSAGSAWWFTEDTDDRFTVRLRLHNDSYVYLFQGDQEQESKALVDYLQRMIGAEVTP